MNKTLVFNNVEVIKKYFHDAKKEDEDEDVYIKYNQI